MRKHRAVTLLVVPASSLGWNKPTDWFVVDDRICEALGTYPTEAAAVRRAASGSHTATKAPPSLQP